MHPTIFVIFGVTGDLAGRKLLPALVTLYSKKLWPQKFAVIGFSRKSFNREEFREFIRERMKIRPGQFKEEEVKHFLDHLSYEQGLFDDALSYDRLKAKFKEIDDRWGQCSNKLFHLSVPPALYQGILKHISSSGMSVPCADDTGWTRVLIEKPFGDDLMAAKSLDKLLGKLFEEEQIFRIDHYLAKESLQNILAFRFANTMFEPLWRREHIDQVHIKLFERGGPEGRGTFYDSMGALKDVGQNHILQMLALVAMETPRSLGSDDIRRERGRVLTALRSIPGQALEKQVVRGQYIGYTNEKGVSLHSQTETYFRIKSYVDLPRWKGVPFYLESGKGLSETKTEIDIYFKNKSDENHRNILTFRIQPDGGIKIRFYVKTPGYSFKTEPKSFRFSYAESRLDHNIPNDYERLIHDAFSGDQTLFASTEEIMACWKFVMPILERWGSLPLKKYEKGTR